MTNREAAKWIQLYIDLAKFDPTTGEEAYLNEDAKKTIEAISFVIPEEYELAEKFKAQHPDWVEIVSSFAIGYKKEVTYTVDMRRTANEIHKNSDD